MGSLKLNGSTSGHVEITAPAVAGTQSVEFPTDVVQKSEYRGHNLLHNGAMQVAQRGTSTASITTNGYYTADRWASTVVTLGTWTQSVEADAPTGSGFRKSLKTLITAGAETTPGGTTDQIVIRQLVEGQNLQSIKKGTASAELLTLSFWTKSNKTGTYVVELFDVDNTRAISATYTVESSGTWERQSITFPADLTGAFDNDNAFSLALQFWLAAGTHFTTGTLATAWVTPTDANRVVGQTNLASDTSNYWQITGVQLEVGSAATGFEHKSYGTELSECQRYYFRSTGGELFGMGWATGATSALIRAPFPTTMRGGTIVLTTTGTAADYILYNNTGSGLASNAVPTLLSATTNLNCGFLSCSTASGLVTGNGTGLVGANASVWIAFSADL